MGVIGSSLSMTSSQHRGHFSVALYRMTTHRHEPGYNVAGKGLLINFQWWFLRLNATLVTCRAHWPTLQMDIVRSAQQQAVTPPKFVEPVTASLPGGALPDKAIVCEPAGSSLVTVRIADLPPKLAGSKRMGTGRKFPAPMLIGNDNTSGARNSPEDEVMPVTESVHFPLLLKISGSSAKEPTHTFPKFPLSAISRTRRGATAVPVTVIVCGLKRSLLKIVIVAVFAGGARLPGWNRITTSMDPPGLTTSG